VIFGFFRARTFDLEGVAAPVAGAYREISQLQQLAVTSRPPLRHPPKAWQV